MDNCTFDSLLEQLPNCERLFNLKEGTSTSPVEIRYVYNEMESFITPVLSIIENAPELHNCNILIISAPGAVGKSTLSKAIAIKKEAILYDLASARSVGGATISGVLHDALGGEYADEFKTYLSEGMQFVIIDALDEGRIRVTEDAFLDFLKGIGSIAESAKHVCFVLLGRTQIAEDAWLALSETTNPRLLAIEPFSREQANEYINNSKRNTCGENAFTPVFEECRKLIFDRLAFSVTGAHGGDASKDFLHYPPVLDVIAELLFQESNLHSLKIELETQSEISQNRSLHLLKTVMIRILGREQEKLSPNIRQKLGERANQQGWNEWNSLYATDEQCKRLLGKVLNIQVNATSRSLPNDFVTDYEESVDEWLLHHPFLQGVDKFANSVFQSYLYARALRGDFGDDLRDSVAAELLKPDNLQLRTRLLAEFYLDDETNKSNAPQAIKPEHFGILYDSLLSSETNKTRLRLTIEGSEPSSAPAIEQDAEGEFEFLSFNDENEIHGETQTIPFALKVRTDSRILFTRSIRNAVVTIPCTVEFGGNTPEFEVGPSVDLNVNKLEIKSESLKVGGKTKIRPDEADRESVILEALACDSTALINRPTVYDRENFFVCWPGAEIFPWKDFKSELVPEGIGDSGTLHTAYIRFKRIATTFRSHGRGSLARTKNKIEHSRVLQGPVGEKLLASLVSNGILEDRGNRYSWNPAKASEHLGVSWGNLRKGECPDTLREYLTKFIQQNSDLFS